MRHNFLKDVSARLSIIIVLLMGSLSVSAQYYLNVYEKRGNNNQYDISNLDSVVISDVKKIDTTPVLTRLVINRDEVSLTKGASTTLSVKGYDEKGVELPLEDCRWKSSDYSIASVDENGVVITYQIGTANIIVYIGDVTDTCAVMVSDSYVAPNYQYVDLGLSVNWATFNVGATNTEEYGDYYSWGEIETKPRYVDSTYIFGDYNKLTKYCIDSKYGLNGFTDGKTTLEPEDDVAHMKWGGNWRMPTRNELEELKEFCTFTWTSSEHYVYGYQVTSKINGNSIFLPAAGDRSDIYWRFVGCEGNYFSSSLSEEYWGSAWSLDVDHDNNDAIGVKNWADRSSGNSVRPVCPSANWQGITSISFDKSSESIIVGNSYKLTATLKSGNDDYSFFSDYYDQITWSSNKESVATVDADGTVTALSVGVATITAAFNSFEATIFIKAIPESVDLGLSVKWATFNVGATSPEDYGDYYAWGETETKSTYNWSNYKYCNGSNTTMTQYCNKSSYGNNGFTDSQTILVMSDDVARQKWGTSWRMPTKTEITELINDCTWTWTTQNGVNGYRVTSNKSGYTDRSIFLPAAGYRDDKYSVGEGSSIFYWSRTLCTDYPDSAWYLYYYSGDCRTGNYDRYSGLPVRPVCP